MKNELKQAFPSITRAWLEEVNKAKLQNRSANQLSVITSFLTNHGLEFPNVAQLLEIVLSSPGNTSPVERGYTFLEMVASKTKRNHRRPENLETLFLLSALKVPVKAISCYESEIKYLEAWAVEFHF